MMISKKDTILDMNMNINVKKTMNIFIVDQSGSMDEYAEVHQEHSYSINDNDEENTNTSEYVKCTMKLPSMKNYQRIIFSCNDFEFKGQIKWLDSDKTVKSMILHNMTRYTPITDVVVDQTIHITNLIGNNINIATISSKDDNIGYFREINQICKKYKAYFDDIEENNILDDYSLVELLFYNKKHGMNLFYSTMNKSERNMQELIGAASAGGGHKLLAASSTMSAVCARTPSQGGAPPHHEESPHGHYKNADISMCSICMDEVREYILSCGHCYACKSCAEKVLDSDPKNKCSFCNKDITWIRKVKMTEDQRNSDHYYKCISETCYNIASVIAKCKPVDSDDSGYHLTFCDKCLNTKKDGKKVKKTYNCFCGCEIKVIAYKVFFS